MSEYEGRQDEIRDLKMPEIEIFHNVYTDSEFQITHAALEFNSICPKTGLPDFGIITIEYIPNDLCLELKSLKLYLTAYRNVGIFMENSVNKIFCDVRDTINPKKLRVTGDFNGRGGIQTSVTRSL
ncbi:NADPH-dependent 7-cyano-7-deazaguanine reductase QueF [candidate division WWE3 bacterium]|uniref:NADPH-dependent 7-cyano-7-deazaguanine reductase n=1 Tax=candidate division WWE3 bacterium TaxID=2053526 RepID=A0A3A4ZEX8_UNCKA|nr:MAG: NADPH-dependent 7-cyano-7-deazaguanine reductase QueF [candidate division WWE3 bacterium]